MKRLKEKTKKILALAISAGVVVSNLVCESNTVYAISSIANTYSTEYTLSGDQAKDIVNVAMAQSELLGDSGYGWQAWCAAFVSDCAVLAGASDAIPWSGGCTTMHRHVLENGGQSVSSTQEGDLVFYQCPYCMRYLHVGILKSNGRTVQGNVLLNSESPAMDLSVYDYRAYCSSCGINLGSDYYVDFVRPAYMNTAVVNCPKPVLSSVLDVTSSGYRVTVTTEGSVSKVEFPTWIDGTKSVKWYQGTKVKDNTFECTISTGDFGYATDVVYFTDVYVFDSYGNMNTTDCLTNKVKVPEKTTPKPVKAQISNRSKKGYTVTCEVVGDVSEVKFATWPKGSKTAKWYVGTKIKDNTYECVVKTEDFGYKRGLYYTDIYVVDNSGTLITSECLSNKVSVPKW